MLLDGAVTYLRPGGSVDVFGMAVTVSVAEYQTSRCLDKIEFLSCEMLWSKEGQMGSHRFKC
jgi:hypothetical protein